VALAQPAARVARRNVRRAPLAPTVHVARHEAALLRLSNGLASRAPVLALSSRGRQHPRRRTTTTRREKYRKKMFFIPNDYLDACELLGLPLRANSQAIESAFYSHAQATALLQIPILIILSYAPLKLSLVLLVSLMGIGNLLYSLALPVNSIAMLFIGRLLCSTTSGLQIANSIIDMELDDPADEYRASIAIAFIYQLGAVFAYILAAFFVLVVTDSVASGIVVNSSTICGYASFGLCVCFLIFMLTRLSQKTLPKIMSKPNQTHDSPIHAVLGVIFVFLFDLRNRFKKKL
jgi:hypothetical protein